ncbi:nitrite reductase small subunit NirD [Kaarinaea lacus]
MLTEKSRNTDWIEVGRVDDVPRLGARIVNTIDGDIAVFRNAVDEIFAVLDRCPHKGGPLSQGIVHGRSVTCPLHNWVLGLDDGQAKAPDEGCVKTYSVKVENNIIYLMV